MATTKKLPTMQQLLRYWYTQLKAEEIAEKLGVSRAILYRLQKRYKLPRREADRRRPSAARTADPTEEEIAQIAKEIQSNWTDAEAKKRWVGQTAPPPWQPPMYTYNRSTETFSQQ